MVVFLRIKLDKLLCTKNIIPLNVKRNIVSDRPSRVMNPLSEEKSAWHNSALHFYHCAEAFLTNFLSKCIYE